MNPALIKAMRALDFLRFRSRHYRMAFGTPEGKAVLADLAAFCRANESCFDPDPRLHAVAEGRREVWLRVQQHLRLSSEELYALATGAAPPNLEQTDV